MPSALRRPTRSASHGAIRQPRMVLSDRIAAPIEARCTAPTWSIPARVARVTTAVASYTEPAHRPTIATPTKAELVKVRRRKAGAQLSHQGADAPALGVLRTACGSLTFSAV